MTTTELDLNGKWAIVALTDSNIFEGTVASTAPHGIYIQIGGDESRLNLFPWSVIARVVYK